MSSIARPPLAFGHSGTTGYEEWRCLSQAIGIALGTASVATGTWYLSKFRIWRPCVLDRLGQELTVTAVGNGHFCIYGPASATNSTPTALLLDSGNISTAASPVVWSGTLALSPGEYWCGFEVSATVTCRTHVVASHEHNVGFASTLGAAARLGFTQAHAYAAYPSPFSGALTDKTTAGIPAIMGRFSA